MASDLLQTTDLGLYCPAGDFYVDPWRRVQRAVITHAHGDHARWGMGQYLCAADGAGVLRARVGQGAQIQALQYGTPITIGGVQVSLHPAGHILGSAQVRIEHSGQVWVVSGDYKTQPDRTCQPFEPVRCHTFVTESTFGLPIYRWAPQELVFGEINRWWQTNADAGCCSLLLGYSLGKAQRLLGGLEPSIGPIILHGAVANMTEYYRAEGIDLPATITAEAKSSPAEFARAIVIAPPSVQGTPWLRRFGDVATAFASGWMAIRGTRRRKALDRGFALSDHVDWTELHAAIRATGAERILVTHGYIEPTVRWLNENGWSAAPLATLFEGDTDEAPVPVETTAAEVTAAEPDYAAHTADAPEPDSVSDAQGELP